MSATSDTLRCCYCSQGIDANDDAQFVSKREYAHTACAFRVNDEFFAAQDANEEQDNTRHNADYFSLFAAHINHLSEHGDEVGGCCPFHEDLNPSWSGNRLTGLWRCLGCGARGNAAQFAERMGEKATMNNGHQQRKIVATYDYRDEDNILLFQAVRFDPKGFSQRRPDGRGGWVYGLNGVRRVLYRLPGILKAETVYIVEGEKDADRLWSLGIPATTNPQGAGKWQQEFSPYFAKKQIVILPDSDAVGEQHALTVARSLLPVAGAVKIVPPS